MTYADLTIGDRNPFKRWLQRRRYSDALAALRRDHFSDHLRVLDFGAGDGEFVRQLVGIASVEAWVYEPTPALMVEARGKLAAFDSVTYAENLGSVESEIFDYIFCLEVLEHLPAKETIAAIGEIHRLLKPAGAAVIGVPHELFLPALVKGLFRVSRRHGDFDASFKNIWKATMGRPPLQRPVTEIFPGLPYHYHHLGFDYRVLEHMLGERLQLKRKWFSPFHVLGATFNSEVYFLLRKVDARVAAANTDALHKPGG